MKDSHHPILCPGCRKLISSDETSCPHCGAFFPARMSRLRAYLRRYSSPSGWVRGVIRLNILIFIFSLLLSRRITGIAADPFSALSPDDQSLLLLGATGTYPIEYLHHWWSLVAANFLHGSLLHIFLNMAALGQIAPLVLRQYGLFRTSSLYILGGVAGFLVSYWAGVVVTIGASAAVCSLVGALLYYGRSRGGMMGQVIFRQVGAAVIMLFFFGLIVPGINNWGHGGGLAAGIGLAFLLGYDGQRHENRFHRILGIGCILVTVVVLMKAVITGLIGRFV